MKLPNLLCLICSPSSNVLNKSSFLVCEPVNSITHCVLIK